MQHMQATRSALLIIDMQIGAFAGPEPLWEGERVLATINGLIERAREAGVPVFAARHTGPAGSPIAPDSAAVQLVAGLAVDPARDHVFDKTRPSCFQGTNLGQVLEQLGIDELVIAGVKTQYCIDTTCRAAAERGLSVVLVEDGHTCTDTPLLDALRIVAHHNATLRGPFARVVPAAEVRFGARAAAVPVQAER
jgi:nicotinamidase-related amidase